MSARLNLLSELILTRLPSKNEVQLFLDILYDEEHNLSQYDMERLDPGIRVTHQELIHRTRTMLLAILDFGVHLCEEEEYDYDPFEPPKDDRIPTPSMSIPLKRFIPPVPLVPGLNKP